MSRSPSVSSFVDVPGCGMHAAKSQRFPSKGAVGSGPSCVTLIDAAARPVDGRVPDVEPIQREVHRIPVLCVDLDQRRGRVRGRQRRAVGVRREHAAPEVRFDREHVPVEHPRGAAVDHLVALEREDADAAPAVAGLGELVDGDHVGVLGRPDAELRIVVELGRVHDVLVARTRCRSGRPSSRPRRTGRTARPG